MAKNFNALRARMTAQARTRSSLKLHALLGQTRITAADFESANQCAASTKAIFPPVESVKYDGAAERLVILLQNGVQLSISPRSIRGLEHARPCDLDNAEISPSGLGIHFRKIDADLYVPSLMDAEAEKDLGQR